MGPTRPGSSQYVSRYSMSRTCGPRDIIFLVIPRMGDNKAEAASTAIYIQNRCPHKSLEEKTPEEVFTGKKPSVGHLRIFGNPVYIHIPKEKRTKLKPSEKELLWDTVRPQNHRESMYHGKSSLRSVEM
jgi:hypothetical protein